MVSDSLIDKLEAVKGTRRGNLLVDSFDAGINAAIEIVREQQRGYSEEIDESPSNKPSSMIMQDSTTWQVPPDWDSDVDLKGEISEDGTKAIVYVANRREHSEETDAFKQKLLDATPKDRTFYKLTAHVRREGDSLFICDEVLTEADQASSEIPVVARKDLAEKLHNAVYWVLWSNINHTEAECGVIAGKVTEALIEEHPGICTRTTEPVMVSLEKCRLQLMNAARYHAADDKHVDGDSVAMTKAVLDAAGVKYE